MFIGVTEETIQTIQALVHDAFDVNSILDRVKTIVSTIFACPDFSSQVHNLAHKYSLDIADGIGDLIEVYNIPIEYGNIPQHIENYNNLSEAVDKVYDSVLTYQNELNQGAKIIFDNMDIHIYQGLLELIEKHNKYVEQVILWKDMIEKYKESPSFDADVKKYDILGA